MHNSVVLAALVACLSIGCKLRTNERQDESRVESKEETQLSDSDNVEVVAAKRVWKELVDAMERGDAAAVARHCTAAGLGALGANANKDRDIGRHYKFLATEFRAVKSKWRSSSDGKKIELDEAGDDGGRFELQRTPDGWKFDQWHQAQ